ncbi:MAG: nucleoside hydrolase [Pseudomonadota bacterium]
MAIPVILDTDIGFDVDDVWALAFLLRCPELDIRLITTTTGDTVYRARLVAKLLQICGREDIPIGIGLALDHSEPTHAAWLGDFSLAEYSGVVLRDGVGAMCDTVLSHSEPVTIIAIGPLPNVAAALAREPELHTTARFVGMHGSLRRGYLGAPKPMREYNVKQYALAAQAVFRAGWPKTITPLDSCGHIILTGERFRAVRDAQDPLCQAVLQNHTAWFEAVADWPVLQNMDSNVQSSLLYDCVAVYLAFSEAGLQMEELPVHVTEDGKTLIDTDGTLGGAPVRCATGWNDESGFLDLLVKRLCNDE